MERNMFQDAKLGKKKKETHRRLVDTQKKKKERGEAGRKATNE